MSWVPIIRLMLSTRCATAEALHQCRVAKAKIADADKLRASNLSMCTSGCAVTALLGRLFSLWNASRHISRGQSDSQVIAMTFKVACYR